jgi:hypothetical protein
MWGGGTDIKREREKGIKRQKEEEKRRSKNLS